MSTLLIIVIILASVIILTSYLVVNRKVLTKVKCLRKKLYRAMLEELTREKHSSYSIGFCRLISHNRPWYMSNDIRDYPELMSHIPEHAYPFIGYWWDPYSLKGKEIRIQILIIESK